jgi:PfaD family protein
MAAAFAAGADYVVTGSVNQACVEAGTSQQVRRMLAQARTEDCAMAPAADMFELGVQVQVLRRGTMFPARAARLFQLYREFDSLDALPRAELERLEAQVLRRSVAQVWAECEAFFSQRDPGLLERARQDPKVRMALVFRWYLGMSSQWANAGDPERIADYQIWCGAAMGAFNDWARGTYLAAPEHRRVADVAHQLLTGAAVQLRLTTLRLAGAGIPAAASGYRPAPRDRGEHQRGEGSEPVRAAPR